MVSLRDIKFPLLPDFTLMAAERESLQPFSPAGRSRLWYNHSGCLTWHNREIPMIKIAFVRLDSGRHDPLRFEQDRREFLAPLCQEFELLEVPAPEKQPQRTCRSFSSLPGDASKNSSACTPAWTIPSSCWPTASTIPWPRHWKFPAGCASREEGRRSFTATAALSPRACGAWRFIKKRAGPWPGASASSASRLTGSSLRPWTATPSKIAGEANCWTSTCAK